MLSELYDFSLTSMRIFHPRHKPSNAAQPSVLSSLYRLAWRERDKTISASSWYGTEMLLASILSAIFYEIEISLNDELDVRKDFKQLTFMICINAVTLPVS